jgi:hypothetical protein
MVHDKNRLFDSLILLWQQKKENIQWKVGIRCLALLILAFIIALLYNRFHKICCCRHRQKQTQETTEYVKIL